MNSLEILAALERTDPAVAGFVVSAMTVEELSDATDQFLNESGEQIVKSLRDRERQFRAEAGGTYVTSVAKSGTPSERAFTLAAAADQAASQAEEIEKAFGFEQWLLGGKTINRRVSRDSGGRFSRGLSNASSSPMDSQWATPGQEPGENQMRMPDAVGNFVQSTPSDQTGQGSSPITQYANDVPEQQQQQVERYLGQVAAVQELIDELKQEFPDKMDDLEMNVFIEPPPGEGTVQPYEVPLTEGPEAVTQMFNENAGNVADQIGMVQYGPKQNINPIQYDQMLGRMSLKEGAGGGLGETAPATLQALGQALRGGDREQYLKPGTQRLKSALQQWGAVMSTLPDDRAKTLGAVLNATGPLADAADKARPGMLKTSFRFRGTKKKTVDPELEMQVTGSQLTPAEQLVFDAEGGAVKPDETVAEQTKPSAKEDAAVIAINDQLGAAMRAEKEALRTTNNEALQRARAAIKQLSAQQKRAMSASGKPRSKQKRALATPGLYGDNWAFNALKHRKDVLNQSGLEATMGAQRDAAAYWFIRQMIAQSSDAREGFDRGRRLATGDSTIAASDVERLTRKIASNLGQGFPSEGVMLDRKGGVVQQSVGAGEDHYLPFDLGGYKSLVGGSYVRTRQVGGPTSEDLLALIAGTGLAGTVVSRSGVFEVEMDQNYLSPTKVGRMARMYERILNDIAAGGLYINEMEPEAKNKELQKRLKQAKYQQNPKLLETDMKQWEYDQRRLEAARVGDSQAHEAEAKRHADLAEKGSWESLGPNTQAKYIRQAKKRARLDAERKLLINGEGYEVALRTLKRYFPYAIKKVGRRELGDFVESITQDPSSTAGNKEVEAADQLTTAEQDKFRVQPGDVYSGGRNALEPSLKPEDGQEFDRPPSLAASPASGGGSGSGGVTVTRPTPSSPGDATAGAGEESSTGVAGTEAGDPEEEVGNNPSQTEAENTSRQNLMSPNGIRQTLTMPDFKVPQNADFSNALPEQAGMAGSSFDSVVANAVGNNEDSNQATLDYLKKQMLQGSATNAQAALRLALTQGRQYEPVVNSTIKALSGADGSLKDMGVRANELAKFLSVVASEELSGALAPSGAGNEFMNKNLNGMAMILSQADAAYQVPEDVSSGQTSDAYDGAPFTYDGMEPADNVDLESPAGRTAHKQKLIGMLRNGLPAHQEIAQSLTDAGITVNPYQVGNNVLAKVLRVDAADTPQISSAVRQAVMRTAADTAALLAIGNPPAAGLFNTAVEEVAGAATDDENREARFRAIADSLIADYSLTHAANRLEWVDSPKVSAGNSQPQPNPIPPYQESAPTRRVQDYRSAVQKSDDGLIRDLIWLQDQIRS